jgi:PIN domain nuclease of toxin-antitoxin system
MVYVLDACAAVAFLRDEPGAPVVEAALTAPDIITTMHAVNLAEGYYVIARDSDEDTADATVQMLITDARINVCRDLDEGFCREVGRLRVAVRSEGWRISLADCFCLATARRLGGHVLTTDRTEFQRLIPHNWCSMQIIA